MQYIRALQLGVGRKRADGDARGINVDTPRLFYIQDAQEFSERKLSLFEQHHEVGSASETGSIANQNRGTLGGNIGNASPAADSPPALLVYDSELELASVRGLRTISYAQFHTGYKQMNLSSDEIVLRIRLPRPNGEWQQYYRKVGTRRAQAISKVCFAARANTFGGKIREIRIALGSVAPMAVRCHQTEALLLEGSSRIRETQQQLADEIRPIDDFRSNARYRARVAQNLLEEFLLQLQRTEPK